MAHARRLDRRGSGLVVAAVSAWTSQEDALLHRLWMLQGLSASLCARQMPGRSRNAIIGRVNRLGFNRPQAAAPTLGAPYPQRALKAPTVARKTGRGNSQGSAEARAIGQRKSAPQGKEPTDLPPTEVQSPNARPWIERKARQCAYPVGGEGADTVSCCNPTDGTYCAGHARIMFGGYGKKFFPSDIGLPIRKNRSGRTFEAWLAA